MNNDTNEWRNAILKRCFEANIIFDDENAGFSLDQLLAHIRLEVVKP